MDVLFQKFDFFSVKNLHFQVRLCQKSKWRLSYGRRKFRYVTSHVTGQAREGHTRQILCTALRLAVQIIAQKEQK